MPNNEAAYFTGDGLLSINNAECNGCNNLSNISASLFFCSQAFWKSDDIYAKDMADRIINSVELIKENQE